MKHIYYFFIVMIAYSITSCQTNDNIENNASPISETEVLLSKLKKTYSIDYQIVDSIPTSAYVLSIEELENVIKNTPNNLTRSNDWIADHTDIEISVGINRESIGMSICRKMPPFLVDIQFEVILPLNDGGKFEIKAKPIVDGFETYTGAQPSRLTIDFNTYRFEGAVTLSYYMKNEEDTGYLLQQIFTIKGYYIYPDNTAKVTLIPGKMIQWEEVK